jgi:transcriptional regulator with XRE-family HTH domain
MNDTFGAHIRERREARRQQDRDYSVRRVAARIGIEPSYLSKIERGEQRPPSEAAILRLAADLGEDPDMLLAMAGKVSTDLQEVIRRRPRLFADLIRQLKDTPDRAVLRLVREVCDGEW